ncbi:M14 family metallopeptidase [Bacillus xiapuensis]|uniref:M14 family metallopeptidase n=1 Tax=Bacillus xiapuensis TaxID=2014075 RepID=UPI000C241A21|nr:M14 family metallocarboxypeptidase [Bacillus xiapuensis]
MSILSYRPYDFRELSDDIEELSRLYSFIQTEEIGRSVEGRPIWEIRIGEGTKKLHFNGSFHANEWITSSVLVSFIKEYAQALASGSSIGWVLAKKLWSEASLSVVPMVNPDGVELVINGPSAANEQQVKAINGEVEQFDGWKANIRGVDLNNQFPANWDIEKERKEPKSPAPRDYPGERPLSEPEAIAMAKLQQREQFDLMAAFHTQGAEFYWGYEGNEPEESRLLAEIFERVSGYQAVRFIDSHAGYKDWFIQEFQRPGFTIELGKGCNPLPLTQLEEIYIATRNICIAALLNAGT